MQKINVQSYMYGISFDFYALKVMHQPTLWWLVVVVVVRAEEVVGARTASTHHHSSSSSSSSATDTFLAGVQFLIIIPNLDEGPTS